MTVIVLPGELDFHYRAPARGDDATALQCWRVSYRDHERDDNDEAGYVLLYRFDPNGNDDFEVLNTVSSELVMLGRAIVALGEGPGGGELTPGLLVDRVWLRADLRGHGLGPALLARVLQLLRYDCRFSALIPAPLERAGKTIAVQDAERESIIRAWERVGYRHFAADIWVLDMKAGF